MEVINEELRNSCGHMARYKIIIDHDSVNVESEIQEDCETCEKEDDEFKKEIEAKLNKYLGG